MKEKLRSKYLGVRAKIKNRSSKDQTIFLKVINNEKVKLAEVILIYVSYNHEVDTFKLINYFLKNKRVAVPKIENDQMNFYFINNIDELKEGYAHILEPTTKIKVTDYEKAVCITPGICFSKDGYRLGYGKGFYDKFFLEHPVYRIGLCYQECLLLHLVKDQYDQKVNEIITDRGINNG